MLKKILRLLIGLNGAALLRGIRLGFPEFVNACKVSFTSVHPFQDAIQNRVCLQFKSIPEVKLGDILENRRPSIKLNVQRYEDGMLPTNDAIALLAILTAEKPEEVLEIGTFMGHTTKAMAENLSSAIIHTVDLPPDFSLQKDSKEMPPKDDFHLIQQRVVGREFKGQDVAQRIRQHYGDTATMDFKTLGNPSIFFIDGSHTYEYCKLDSEKCLAAYESVGRGFLWHDCDVAHPGVIKFVLEWINQGREIVRIQDTALAYWKIP